VLAAAVDLVQKTASGREVEVTVRVIPEQLGESEDRIQWSTQLVAHAGEELALGPIRAVSLGLGLLQGRLRLPGLGDVL